MKETVNKLTHWYVAKTELSPVMFHNLGGQQMSLMRGHLIKVASGTPHRKAKGNGILMPERGVTQNDISLAPFATAFVDTKGFTESFWGPYSDDAKERGIWMVNSNRHSISQVLLAGALIQFAFLQDGLREQMKSRDLYASLMGDSCLTFVEDRFVITPVVKYDDEKNWQL